MKSGSLVPERMKLQKEIKSVVETKHAPNPKQLVVADGFDVFEKEHAAKFFSGKSMKDVLEHLQARMFDPLAGGEYQLEEWSVLKPSARYYNLPAYLEISSRSRWRRRLEQWHYREYQFLSSGA